MPDDAYSYLPYYSDDSEYRLLLFNAERLGVQLPIAAKSPYNHLFAEIVLVDQEDSKEYTVNEPMFYEKVYNNNPEISLQSYMYCHHFCNCHHKSAARAAGADCDDDCNGPERFLVKSIVYPPQGLILYSETMSLTELESRPEFLKLKGK